MSNSPSERAALGGAAQEWDNCPGTHREQARESTMSDVGQRYNVGGIYLPRPFKIRRLGHFGFNVEKLPEGREFYGDLLGFTASDTLDFSRAPCFTKDADLGDQRRYFMRYGTDHHAFVLFP